MVNKDLADAEPYSALRDDRLNLRRDIDDSASLRSKPNGFLLVQLRLSCSGSLVNLLHSSG